MIPLYGFLEGDTLGLLVLARAEWTISEIAAQLRAAANVRVAWEGPAQVIHEGRVLDPKSTVAATELHALDRIDVRRVAS